MPPCMTTPRLYPKNCCVCATVKPASKGPYIWVYGLVHCAYFPTEGLRPREGRRGGRRWTFWHSRRASGAANISCEWKKEDKTQTTCTQMTWHTHTTHTITCMTQKLYCHGLFPQLHLFHFLRGRYYCGFLVWKVPLLPHLRPLPSRSKPTKYFLRKQTCSYARQLPLCRGGASHFWKTPPLWIPATWLEDNAIRWDERDAFLPRTHNASLKWISLSLIFTHTHTHVWVNMYTSASSLPLSSLLSQVSIYIFRFSLSSLYLCI